MAKKNNRIRICFLGVLLSQSVHAGCPSAVQVDDPAFCASFKQAAECHCMASGLPKGMCTNMSLMHSRMVGMFGSLRRACEFQHDTSTQNCIDDWNCYRNGGVSSDGKLCSGTGEACD